MVKQTQLAAAAAKYPFWTLNDRQLCDFDLLVNGGFAPLKTFLDQTNYESVLDNMRTADGAL